MSAIAGGMIGTFIGSLLVSALATFWCAQTRRRPDMTTKEVLVVLGRTLRGLWRDATRRRS